MKEEPVQPIFSTIFTSTSKHCQIYTVQQDVFFFSSKALNSQNFKNISIV